MILKLIFLVCCMSFFCRSQAQQISLFDEETVLDITLSGDLDKLFKDRVGEATYLNLHLRYRDERGELVEIPIKSKTRGNFRRRKNVCTYPPLLLNFSKSTSSNSIFHQQDKVKLVMPCKMDKYVIREYYAYKLFNLISEKSFKVRLVRITLEDSSGKMKQEGPFYAFLIEEEEQLAKRNGIEVLKKDFLRPELVIKEDFLAMAVFQYLIGNTDWSVQYRQNIKLFSDQYQENIVAVPYDFDHAGIVSAPYAKPAEALKLSSVLERRYRGYCIQDMEKFEHVFTIFNERKDDIYEIYTGSPYLEKSYINSTLKYLNAFYRTINSPRLAKVEFTYPCDPEGTGHVVIKGLREIEDQD